jgi:hypothetical protein
MVVKAPDLKCNPALQERCMPREFYTERDIEDMCKRGILSLELNDNIVLTEMAYERARSAGLKLVRSTPDHPPSAPMRPYISQKQGKSTAKAAPALDPVMPEVSSVAAELQKIPLQQRIRDAVMARLGTQVDGKLLDVIIKRVLNSTGVR